MPYPITEENGKYCVNGKCYDAKSDAEKYQAALYANVPDTQKAASGNRGAMIAFYVQDPLAGQLSALAAEYVETPESPEALHCTLVYLAEDATQIESQQQALIDALVECAARCTPIVGEINGFGRFFNNEESHALYANVDAWKLPDFRQDLVRLVRAVGVEPDQTHGFSPHITLAYIPPDLPTPTLPMTPAAVAFGALTLAWGDQHYTFPMGQALQGKSLQVFKQANGLYRWNSLSSGNIQDRDKETITLKALQADVARTKMFGDETSDLTLYHIPYSLGGPPDFRAIIDGILIETGEFYDEPVAKAVAEYIVTHPEGIDGSGWGTSIEFMGVPDKYKTYQSVLINGRSVLPLSVAAFAYSSFGVKNKMALTPEQQQALETVLGNPALMGVVKSALSAQEQSKMANADGVIRKQVQQKQVEVPVFTKSGQYDATPQSQLGFGNPGQAHQKDASGIAAAIQTEAEAVTEAVAASDRAGAAMAQTDAQIALALAEGSLAAKTAEATEEAAEAPPAQPVQPAAAKAADSPDEGSDESPADETAKGAGMSDDDLQAIAKYVNETVAKAVGEAVAKMQGDMQKMRQTFSAETQVKMLNEVPRSTIERLKAFGSVSGQGIRKDEPGYVEKGQNLPEAPGGVGGLMAALGFDSPGQE